MRREKLKILPAYDWPGYAKRPEVIHCKKKNPMTGNVLKSFCENDCEERRKGCKPEITP